MCVVENVNKMKIGMIFLFLVKKRVKYIIETRKKIITHKTYYCNIIFYLQTC
jgi:hypothetical protein